MRKRRDEDDPAVDGSAAVVVTGHTTTSSALCHHHHHHQQTGTSEATTVDAGAKKLNNVISKSFPRISKHNLLCHTHPLPRWKLRMGLLLLSIVSLVSVLLSYLFITRRRHEERIHNLYYNFTHQTRICESKYTADYFTNLMENIQSKRATATELCIPDIIGNNIEEKCRCHNPLVPVPQDRVENWDDIRQQNLQLIEAYKVQQHEHREPNVILFGDSVTERLLGRFFGKYGPKMQAYANMTQELLLNYTNEASIHGILLGISSDEIAHLLYRLQNGELSSKVHPRLYWTLIGTNDLTAGCSAEVIVAGNIRIVQEILKHAHHSRPKVVINSLFPRGAAELLHQSRHWKILQQVNQQLLCYALQTPDVEFVNTTSLFVSERGEGDRKEGVYIRQDYFEQDNLHPSVEGSRVWEEVIIQQTMELMG